MSDTHHEAELTDHAYDGIQEFDNPTPGWWTWIFIATCIFGVVYWFIATMSNGGLGAERELALDKAMETAHQFAEIGELKPDAATLVKFSHDPKWVTFGEGIFISKCMTCHNRDGSGGTGPNLTDDSYINVKKIEDIYDVVLHGRNNGAMPSWRTTLNENEMIIVSSYVASLRGQNKSGKPAEPNASKCEPWSIQQVALGASMEMPIPSNIRGAEETLIKPQGRVLSTLEADGSRRWLSPRLSKGRLWQMRRVVAYVLLALFTITPYVNIGNHPAILLDVGNQRFHIFGATFLPTDTVLLALLVLMVGLSVFLFTAIAGRVFCGWACPQTVFLEFVYRPLERLFYGTTGRGGKTKSVSMWRRIALHVVYLLVSIHLANTLLAYFVSAKFVHGYIWTSTPFEHPGPFIMVALITAWMIWDFAFWREQMCMIACPYGRLQSVMLDRSSLIVSYDVRRGEPRGKMGSGFRVQERKVSLPVSTEPRTINPDNGDCIDCTLCVQVCPTGIDIREGLQFECVNCTQCIDACDTVMDRIGKPRGLIGFSSQAARSGEPVRWVRPRVVIYPLILLIVGSLFTYLLLTRNPFDLTILRAQGRPFVIAADGSIENTMRFKIVNRMHEPRSYRVESVDPDVQFITANAASAVALEPLASVEQPFQVRVAATKFVKDHVDIEIKVSSDAGESMTRFIRLVGPATPTNSATVGGH